MPEKPGQRKTAISDYLMARVSELAISLPNQFSDGKALDEYRQIVRKMLSHDLC